MEDSLHLFVFALVHYVEVLSIVCGLGVARRSCCIMSAGSPLPLSGKKFTPSQLVDSLKHPVVSRLQRASPYAFATDSTRRKSHGTKYMYLRVRILLVVHVVSTVWTSMPWLHTIHWQLRYFLPMLDLFGWSLA